MGKQLLISEGFEVVNISLVPRQTQMVGRILDWLRLFAIKTFFEGIDPGETEVMLGEVVDAFEVDANDPDSNRWMVMYVRLRVVAKRTV